MEVAFYKKNTETNLLPSINIQADRNVRTGKLVIFDIEIGWLKWGISFMFLKTPYDFDDSELY